MTRYYVVQTITTNNFEDKEMASNVQKLWQEASSKIPVKNETIYGLYHSYRSNYRGDYHLSVATKEWETETVIDTSEEKKFEVFKVVPNNVEGVFQTWQHIWQLEEEGHLKRSYEVDFESYHADGTIEIVVGIV